MTRVRLYPFLLLLIASSARAAAPVLGPPLNLSTVHGLPRAVAIGDLDGDTHADLAVACEADSFVTILYGQGGGAFDPPVDLAVGPAPSCIAIADWNHDGKLDIIVGIGSANPRLRALLGNGGRTFVAGAQAALASPGRDLALADFDGDGKLDVVGVESAAPSDGFIFPGTANGSFGVRRNLPGRAGFAREWIAVGHFDANASLDVYIPSLTSDGRYYFQDGAGGFDIRDVASSPSDAAIVDWNQDGLEDLLTGGEAWPPAIHRLEFQRNTGADFELDHTFAAPGPFAAFGTADLDGNGVLDVVMERRFGTAIDVVLLSCSGAVLEDQVNATGSSPIGLAIGDVDGDGKLDVVTADYGAVNLTLRLGLLPGPRTCAPAALPSTTAIDFGSAPQGQPSDYGLVIQNTGSTVLHLGTPQVDNPEFVILPEPYKTAVPPGQQSNIVVRYKRLVAGTAQGTLTVPTDDPNLPTLTVTLNGAATTTVGVPSAGALRLALGALSPSPVTSAGRSILAYTLANDALARIEAYDVRGRLLWSRDLQPVPGAGSIEIRRGDSTGMVWFRLVQAGRESTRRAVFL
jgi:hypothetical protein